MVAADPTAKMTAMAMMMPNVALRFGLGLRLPRKAAVRMAPKERQWPTDTKSKRHA